MQHTKQPKWDDIPDATIKDITLLADNGVNLGTAVWGSPSNIRVGGFTETWRAAAIHIALLNLSELHLNAVTIHADDDLLRYIKLALGRKLNSLSLRGCWTERCMLFIASSPNLPSTITLKVEKNYTAYAAFLNALPSNKRVQLIYFNAAVNTIKDQEFQHQCTLLQHPLVFGITVSLQLYSTPQSIYNLHNLCQLASKATNLRALSLHLYDSHVADTCIPGILSNKNIISVQLYLVPYIYIDQAHGLRSVTPTPLTVIMPPRCTHLLHLQISENITLAMYNHTMDYTNAEGVSHLIQNNITAFRIRCETATAIYSSLNNTTKNTAPEKWRKSYVQYYALCSNITFIHQLASLAAAEDAVIQNILGCDIGYDVVKKAYTSLTSLWRTCPSFFMQPAGEVKQGEIHLYSLPSEVLSMIVSYVPLSHAV